MDPLYSALDLSWLTTFGFVHLICASKEDADKMEWVQRR